MGKFNIENYDVTIDDVTETRQRIIYYDLENNEITRVRYTGNIDEIPEGYVNLNGCPPKVMRWQFRAQLTITPSPDNNFGSLENHIIYLISQMTGNDKIITESAWNHANIISRYSPIVSSFATIIGLSESEIDDIFINASQIKI